VQKRIEEAEIQHRDEPIAVTTNIFSSPISEEIQECEFPRKFTIPTFDAYSSYELSDPTSLTLPRQDGGLFPEQPPYVSNLGSSLRLVLFSFTTLDPQFRMPCQVVPLSVLLPTGVQEEQ